MTVNTGGPIRGFISRWLVRFEASQQIISAAFLGVTAASTLTTALASLGMERYAPWVLGAGLAGTPIFAYAYVEAGVFNRKNRERVDRGDNFAGPGMAMSQLIQAEQLAALGEALAEETDPKELRGEINDRTARRLREFRDGINVQEVYGAESNGQEETRA
jgi:hypothetical protein